MHALQHLWLHLRYGLTYQAINLVHSVGRVAVLTFLLWLLWRWYDRSRRRQLSVRLGRPRLDSLASSPYVPPRSTVHERYLRLRALHAPAEPMAASSAPAAHTSPELEAEAPGRPFAWGWRVCLAGLLVVLIGALALTARHPQASTEAKASPRAAAVPRSPRILSGKVVSVQDGDTLGLLVGRQQVRIRLFGIDAPESSQDYGSKAKHTLSSQVFGREVRVEVLDRDRYGRTVGRVLVGNSDVNAEMVRRGMAWAYRHFSDRYGPLEDAARKRHRGLWASPNPMQPYDFRRGTS